MDKGLIIGAFVIGYLLLSKKPNADKQRADLLRLVSSSSGDVEAINKISDSDITYVWEFMVKYKGNRSALPPLLASRIAQIGKKYNIFT